MIHLIDVGEGADDRHDPDRPSRVGPLRPTAT
jgi:hypothetical protein